MATSAREVLAERERRGFPKDFCIVPFTTLLFEADGLVGACRQKGSEFAVGDIRVQSLEEIWNGPFLRQWRREFLEGSPKICKSEVREKLCHLCPQYDSLAGHFSFDEVQKRPPARLGLNFNGQCNLQCRMCTIWKKPNGLYDQIGFYETLEELIPTLQEVEFLSGEPFIQKDTYRLIDQISAKNPECQWTFTTNAHWKLTGAITRALDKVKVKNTIVSLDSLSPGTYAKIRCSGDLKVPLENLDRLLEYDRSRLARGLGGLNIVASFTIQKDNWVELGDFHEFGKSKGIPVFRAFLKQPPQFSLLSLSESEREGVLDHYWVNLSAEQISHAMPIIVPLLDSLPPITRGEQLLKMKKRCAPAAHEFAG